MAAKKTSKNDAERGKKKIRGKIENNIRKEIKAAVENIPAMIIGEIKENTARENAEPTTPITVSRAPFTSTRPPKIKQIILWLGVSVITFSILIMWGWNMQAAFTDQKMQVSAEQQLLESAKSEISKVFDSGIDNAGSVRKGIMAVIEVEKTKAETEKSVNESLEMILAANASATAAGTTTIQNLNPVATTSTKKNE